MIFVRFFVLAFLILFFSSFVSAGLAVTTLYSKNFPLELRPGETRDVEFIIQNALFGDTMDLTVEVFPEESAIASFPDKLVYDIGYGESAKLPVKIKIPTDAKQGEMYEIRALFKDITKREEKGQVSFTINLGAGFPVRVLGENEESIEEKIKGAPEDKKIERGESEEIEEKMSSGKAVWLIFVLILIAGIVVFGFFILKLMRAQKESKLTSQYATQPLNTKIV